jgi:hypothetical protein
VIVADLKAPLVDVTLCGAESLFTTLTFVPGFTVSGAPKLKFLIVIVADEAAAPCEGEAEADAAAELDGDALADGDAELDAAAEFDGDDELDDDPEPEEEQAAAISRANAATPMRRSALITARYDQYGPPVQ